MSVDELQKIIMRAVEMERKGKDFYALAVERSTPGLQKEVFKILMDDETRHINRLKIISDSISAKREWSNKWTVFGVREGGLKIFFCDLVDKYGVNDTRSEEELNILEIGLDLERRAINFYEETLKSVEDPNGRKFLNKMIQDEESHQECLPNWKPFCPIPNDFFSKKNELCFQVIHRR